MNSKIFKHFALFVVCVIVTSSVQAQSSITVSGESFASVDTKDSLIKFTIEQNSPILSQVDTFAEKEIQKLPKDKMRSITLTKKELINANPGNPEITKGGALKAIFHYSIICDSKNSFILAESLLSLPSAKIQITQSIPNTSSDSFKQAYADSVAVARSKAEAIAKSSNMNLGKILEVTSTEEVPPSVIREQLLQDPQSLNNGSSELRIFSTIKFELVSKTLENTVK